MRYYVSLVDHDADVKLLEVAAKQLYREAMLIKQDALCRLEDERSMVEILQASYNLNELLHNVVGELAAKYTRPLELNISDFNFKNGISETDLTYVLTYNLIALKKMAGAAIDKMLGDDKMCDLLGISNFLDVDEIKEIENAMDEFFGVVQTILEKQAKEFIKYATAQRAFTVCSKRNSIVDTEDGGEVTVNVIEK